MEIYTDVRGTAGVDCGGFCEFCFYKNVDFNNLKPIGCINCPPNRIGCTYCQNFIDRISTGFKPLYQVLADLNEKFNKIEWNSLNPKDLQIIVAGAADILNYPQLYELVSILKESPVSLHLGYTSGKPIKNVSMAENLVSMGVDEVSFSVFSTNPEMRRKWMNDKTPVESVKSLKIFCENINLNASTVVIPGVNDGDIFETCANLEEWSANSLTLRRFANFKRQGLILNNKAIIEGINPHSYEEFQEFVKKVGGEFSFKVFGYPYYDPKNGSPFTLSKSENRSYLEKLPDITSEATIITGALAEPFLKKIFRIIDENNQVNIVGVDKEIADLITHEDLEFIYLADVKSNVVIPSGALVHDKQAAKILCKDGKNRKIVRGPLILTYPYRGGDEHLTNKIELIEYELKSFEELINTINSFKNR
jgi:[methyl coenzyme M reductase]-L-arginine C-5-methyltransferase